MDHFLRILQKIKVSMLHFVSKYRGSPYAEWYDLIGSILVFCNVIKHYCSDVVTDVIIQHNIYFTSIGVYFNKPYYIFYQQIIKHLGRFASLNQNINIASDPTHMNVDHAAHASWSTMFTQSVMTPTLMYERC